MFGVQAREEGAVGGDARAVARAAEGRGGRGDDAEDLTVFPLVALRGRRAATGQRLGGADALQKLPR